MEDARKMKIWITYDVPTAEGFWREHEMIADTFEEADEICEAIERNGYKLVQMVTQLDQDEES